jgi:hypothetical protein
MDAFDKLLKNVSYKFDKGYPDSPEDMAKLFEMVNNLVKEEEKADGVVTKDEIIKVLQTQEFTPEQLKRILSSVSSIKFKEEIISYISSKGKGPSAVAESIYNKMVATGDAPVYAEYLKNMKNYSYLGDSGNLAEKFNFISKELVDFLLTREPSIGRVSTGKGEILLSVMLSDVKDAVGGGDIQAGGKEVEVKNKGAVPMGQKAQFGVNTMETVYSDIESKINPKLEVDISIKGGGERKRPFNKLGLAFDQIIQNEPDNINDYVAAVQSSLETNYPGLDFSQVKVANFVNGNSFDWLGLELALSKEVVKLYIKSEGFEEIFFLNDQNKNYKKVPTDKLVEMLGKEVKIYFKDGLPRWEFKF